ncbi:hypothetical protein GGS24DRAFT_447030 [Hypoxylon argillaceum]|nr:hypothetical protein GGS24DRAFT_447030 [Hypoxylon argillaceum]KAI1146136.1 hypothetical protein F4825DRAFT_466782 [Nemania diffusa]
MERALVCTSLRKRLDWSGLPSLLLQSSSAYGKWKETRLETHDVAIPLTAHRIFRAIFISPQDVASARSLSRIERLYNLTGGQDSGIIFLLKHGDDGQSAVPILMALQLQLVGNWELPVIPVEFVTAVPASLLALQRQLVSPDSSPEVSSPASNLLPFCSNKERLAEHSVNILTDVTSRFKDLISKLSSDRLFQSEISQLLDEDAHKLRGFWREDCLVD